MYFKNKGTFYKFSIIINHGRLEHPLKGRQRGMLLAIRSPQCCPSPLRSCSSRQNHSARCRVVRKFVKLMTLSVKSNLYW